MKECCVDGWTKGMGQDDNGVRPRCVAWQPVFVSDPKASPPVYPVEDCVIGWVPDLISVMSDQIEAVSAETGQVRKSVHQEVGRAAVGIARMTGLMRMGLKRAMNNLNENGGNNNENNKRIE
jgi:hypothetical protein